MTATPKYSSEDRLRLVRSILNDGRDIKSIADENAVSITTLRSWIQAYNEYGPIGLEGRKAIKRLQQEADAKALAEEREGDFQIIKEAVQLTLKTIQYVGNDYGRSILHVLEESGAWQNPEFGSFLFYIYRAYRCIVEMLGRESRYLYPSEEEDSVIFCSGYMMFSTVPFKGTRRREAEELIIQKDETKQFICNYIDSLATVLSQKEYQKNTANE